MTELDAANVLQAMLVLVAGVLVCFWMMSKMRLDTLRQKLFLVRDEMFDYALDGNISFDDHAYILLRDEMNSLIRYGHQLTFFRGTMTFLMRHTSGIGTQFTWNRAWDRSLKELRTEKVRKDMLAFHDRAVSNVMKHIISGSPILIFATSVVMVCEGIRLLRTVGGTSLRQLALKASVFVLRDRLDTRILEEDAMCAV